MNIIMGIMNTMNIIIMNIILNIKSIIMIMNIIMHIMNTMNIINMNIITNIMNIILRV